MNQKTAVLSTLAVLSVATLLGGFAIQVAEAAEIPRGVRIGPLSVTERGVQLTTEAVRISIGESGVAIVPAPERE
jgi:hypothetical protein